jgi:hypothetical protein
VNQTRGMIGGRVSSDAAGVGVVALYTLERCRPQLHEVESAPRGDDDGDIDQLV